MRKQTVIIVSRDFRECVFERMKSEYTLIYT